MKSLAPGFLVATPHLADSNFARAVVLVIEHTPKGAMGLIINRTAPLTFKDLARSQELQVAQSKVNHALFHGGPVEPYRGFVLHDSCSIDERNEVIPGLYLSTTSHALSPLLMDEKATVRFCLGYAGWGAGQLEKEVREGSWLYTEGNPRTVLREEPSRVWDAAIKSMGIEPGWLMAPGGVN
ncbi:MAG TPA: YqgE/AlgH family protein [Archangium sp.]|jgi:putative transcriptional regulator